MAQPAPKANFVDRLARAQAVAAHVTEGKPFGPLAFLDEIEELARVAAQAVVLAALERMRAAVADPATAMADVLAARDNAAGFLIESARGRVGDAARVAGAAVDYARGRRKATKGAPADLLAAFDRRIGLKQRDRQRQRGAVLGRH